VAIISLMSCSISECERPHEARGLCSTHYYRLRTNGDPLKLRPKGGLNARPLGERFEEKVDRSRGADECHIWTGGKVAGSAGYGFIKYMYKNKKATHAAWFLEYGIWPTQNILHSCDNPPCVNVKHLSEGTQAENNRQIPGSQ
jgi:hypothetical protein